MKHLKMYEDAVDNMLRYLPKKIFYIPYSHFREAEILIRRIKNITPKLTEDIVNDIKRLHESRYPDGLIIQIFDMYKKKHHNFFTINNNKGEFSTKEYALKWYKIEEKDLITLKLKPWEEQAFKYNL